MAPKIIMKRQDKFVNICKPLVYLFFLIGLVNAGIADYVEMPNIN